MNLNSIPTLLTEPENKIGRRQQQGLQVAAAVPAAVSSRGLLLCPRRWDSGGYQKHAEIENQSDLTVSPFA